MKKDSEAFTASLQKGHIRIVLKIDDIIGKVENSAPDFVSAKKDAPKLLVTPKTDISEYTDVFSKSYSLRINEHKSTGETILWELNGEDIWFDVPMDAVKNVWLTEFNFAIESASPRYLAYYIEDVSHHLMWLQENEENDKIHVLSDFKKTFRPTALSGKQNFSGAEILMCCDMLGRSIQKIDLRTGNALVKFNTEKGRLSALLQGMAERLGYKIEALDKETIRKKKEKGQNVSHIISLK